MFKDRLEAGNKLADALKNYKDRQDTVVLALPRGGIVPAYAVAEELNLPLEVIMIKKLGHPNNPEYAIGAVSIKGRVLNGPMGVDQEYIEEATKKIRALLEKRFQMYHGNKPPIDLTNKTIIVVDDGVATGKTIMAALELLHQSPEKPNKIIVAVPVGPTDSINELKDYADQVICLETYDDFYAISLYYRNFEQVTDEEVKEYLRKATQLKATN